MWFKITFRSGLKFANLFRFGIALLSVLLTFSCLMVNSQPEKKEMKPALLVIDVQQAFLPYMSKTDQDMAIEMMNWSIQSFRKYDLPVIRIYHRSDEWGVKPGVPEFEFPANLQVVDTDPKIIKTYPSAFVKTGLDELLKEKGVNTLFLCGLSSTGCVLATYFDAGSHDCKAFMLKDAMMGPKESYTDAVEDMFSALDLETMMYMLDFTR
ncbi:MAG: cysteine hydrolase [Bacteroidetes bacterium]|nr:cysteine hydrolase [Bacteroidota bacterium]